MAKTNTGVLGVFVGTIGPVTGFMHNGQNIVHTSTSSIKNKSGLKGLLVEKFKR